MVLSVLRHSIDHEGRCSSKDEEQQGRKKKRYSNSVGQQYQQYYPSIRETKKRERDSGVVHDHIEYAMLHQAALETFHLDQCISEFCGCKCSRKGNASSCFLNCFFDSAKGVLDRNSAIESLRVFRHETQHKTEKEMNAFAESKFIQSVVGEHNGKLNMKYDLNGHEVCRESFCFAYAMTAFQIKKIAKLAKNSKNAEIKLSNKIKTWKDNHVHDITLAESRELFVSMVAEQNLEAGPHVEASE